MCESALRWFANDEYLLVLVVDRNGDEGCDFRDPDGKMFLLVEAFRFKSNKTIGAIQLLNRNDDYEKLTRLMG